MSADSTRTTSAQPGEWKGVGDQPRVLVSVLSYNSSTRLLATLRCLHRQTYSNYRLQLIDNASTDDLPADVRREFPDLCVRVARENTGYTGGVNSALAQAVDEAYDHVLLCTHDVEIDERAIECLVETAANHADAGVVGGVEARRGARPHTGVGTARFSKWTARLRWLPPPARGRASGVPYVHGALVLFTSRALGAGVRMDENLFMYFDEVDLGIQLDRRGLRAYVDPRVVVNHDRQSEGHDAREAYLMQRNRAYIVRKHGRWYHVLFYNIYAALIELPVKVFVRILQGHAGFAWACVRGHADGLRGRMGRTVK